jgi:hypothetical protein
MLTRRRMPRTDPEARFRQVRPLLAPQASSPTPPIYAARPWGADARAVVALEPEDGSFPPEAAGLEYFLEVEVAIKAATVSTAGTRFTQVLYYAENDAFLFDGS